MALFGTGGLQSMDVMGLPSTGGLADIAPSLNTQMGGVPAAYPYPSQTNDLQAQQDRINALMQALGMGAKIAGQKGTPQMPQGPGMGRLSFPAANYLQDSPYIQGYARNHLGIAPMPPQNTAIQRMPGLLGVGNGTA